MKATLSDVCNIIAGYAFKGKDFNGDGYPVIKITDIQPPYASTISCSHVNLSSYDTSKLTKYLVSRNDFVIAMTGATIGKIGRITSGQAYINQRVAKFEINDSTTKAFVYQLLLSDSFTTHINSNIDSQSAQPNISAGSIGRFEFDLPTKDQQRHIVDILGSIDEQIEINEQEIRKINDLALCFIAKSNNLNTELKPYIKFIKGKKPIENGSTTAPYLSIDAITSFRYESVCSDDMIMATPFDILMVMDGASSGTVFSHQAGVVSSTIAKIDCSDNIKDYLYWYLLSLKEIIKSRNTGSAIPHANKEYISSLKFDYGFATDIKTINILHSLRTKIIQLQEENKKLQELKGLYLKKFFE